MSSGYALECPVGACDETFLSWSARDEHLMTMHPEVDLCLTGR